MKSHVLLASFLIAAASLAPSGAFAEGNCPDGYYPNPAGCAPAGVPTDGYRDYKNQIQRESKEHQEAVDKEYNKWKQKAHGVREVDSYSALAWHPDANDYWAIWDSNTSEAFAKERALEYCNKAMKKGCTVAVSGKNMAMGIAMVDGMITEIAWDVDADIALIAVMKKCEAKWGANRCLPFSRIKPTKVIDSRLDFLNGHVPNPEQTIRYKKGTKTIERSSEPAANYINQGNFEKEAKYFVEKWGPKIRQMAERQQNPEMERAARVR
ncbi:MAG: DUF4189 domain-containing protein [Candidatus Competibacteraceae bacterium]|nr:DUF4189 domain-containing protein [Candidatus Competibacteraceae bacterium]